MTNREDARRILGSTLDGHGLGAIRAEYARAVEKHGWKQTPANPDMFDSAKLIILVEEIGEVARAMTYDEGNKSQLRDELLQVATMAFLWYTSLLEV